MELSKAIDICDSRDVYSDDILEKVDSDYMICCQGPVIYIPDKDVAMVAMTFLRFEEDHDDYVSDWSGTAFIENGVFTRYEQDGFEVALYNQFARDWDEGLEVDCKVAQSYESFMDWYAEREYEDEVFDASSYEEAIPFR